jgi:transposase
MQVVHEVCCGLDVHKKSVTACVLAASGKRRQTREFATFTRDLLELADWLRGCGVTHVALESTGVYWKPVWNLLEGQFEVLLVALQFRVFGLPNRPHRPDT